MKDLLNCPNCAAPIESDICPYCGSVFLDWTTFDTSKPTFIKVKNAWTGTYDLLKLGTTSVREEIDYSSCPTLYENERYYRIKSFPNVRIECEFVCYPFFDKVSGKEVVAIHIDPKKADEETKRQYINNGKE